MDTVATLLGDEKASTVDDLLGSESSASSSPQPAPDVQPGSQEDLDTRMMMGRDIAGVRYPLPRNADELSGQNALAAKDFAATAASQFPTPATIGGEPWYQMEWGQFRNSNFGRNLMGPLPAEEQFAQEGLTYGVPGGYNGGLLPSALSTPIVPFGPGEIAAGAKLGPAAMKAATTAGNVMLAYFIGKNVQSQPERIAAINEKFKQGDTGGAYHDIIGDLIDTGLTAAGAHELGGQAARHFEGPANTVARMLDEHTDAADFGNGEVAAQLSVPGRTPSVDAVLRQGMQPAPTMGTPVVTPLPGLAGAPRGEKPTVPETPPEPERNLTAVDEIRTKNAQTIAQVQAVFPKAQLTREQARALRNAAWGKPGEGTSAASVEPPPGDVTQPGENAETPPPTTQVPPENAAPAANLNVKETAPPAEIAKTEENPPAPAASTSGIDIDFGPGMPFPERLQATRDSIDFYKDQIAQKQAALEVLKDPDIRKSTQQMLDQRQQDLQEAQTRLAAYEAEAKANPEKMNETASAPKLPPPPTDGEIMGAKAALKVNHETMASGKWPNGKKLTPSDRAKLEIENQGHIHTLEGEPRRRQVQASEYAQAVSGLAANPGKKSYNELNSVVHYGKQIGFPREKILADLLPSGEKSGTINELLDKHFGKEEAKPSAAEPWQMTLSDFAGRELELYKSRIQSGEPYSAIWNPEFKKRLPEMQKQLSTVPAEKQLEVFKNNWRDYHKSKVELALEEGKAVPAKVLKDYPDLQKPKIAREGRSAPAKARKVSVPAQTAGTPAPSVHPLRQMLNNNATGIKSVVAPHTLGLQAGSVANALRHFMGENAMASARAEAALHSWRGEFDKTPLPSDYKYDPAQPLPHNYGVIDALERNRAALPQRYRDLADTFDKEFAWRIKAIQQFHPDALQHLIENYFPHIWEDPQRASGVMAQVASRLFAGRKEFLKERSLPFFEDGLKAGLKPISDNPVDLLMAKMHSMDKFLLALKATSEFRATGAMKFKYLFDAMPDGWRAIDDPSFIVQKPPMVKFTEAFDAYQRSKLKDLLNHLGVKYERVAGLDAWAEAHYSPKLVRARAGSHEPTLWHELGHHMDWAFPDLRDSLDMRGQSPGGKQLRSLADLRAEGQPVTSSYRDYLHKSEEKIAEIFRAYVHAPELFKKTAPDVLNTVNKFLDTQPYIRDRLNEMRNGRLAMGSETTEKNLGGMLQLGHWIMPDGPAKVIQNYLSPGLARFGAYRTFRGASNILNAAQLGLSGFHLGFTSLDAATSRLAIGIEDAARGDLGRAAKTIASVPAAPVTNILQGRKMIQEARYPGSTDAETAGLVRALEMGGGRVGQDAFWKTNFTARMKRAFYETRNNSALLEMPDIKAALNAPFALVEQAMRPIMDYVVPRQKLGVFADMARRELEQLGPDATVPQTREAMRKAWDSVDNRMGQLVYDNLFYNRAVKDMALLSFRAYGWQLGKYREGLGAIADTGAAARAALSGQRPQVSHRMAYAMALPLMVGTLGAMVNYMMTGKRPEGQDYFMPRTGDTDANGNPVRLNFPSYMKDVVAYSKHPVTSVAHSLNPMFSGMFDLYQNKDFYNLEIRHPDDPLWQQAGEVAKFAAKQFTPFSVSGAMNLRDNAAPVQKQVLPFFGITPVPARLTMTPAQELASDLMGKGMGDEPLTQEQFDKGKMIRDIAKKIKAAPSDRGQILQDARETGKLNPAAMESLMDRMKYTPLQFQVFHLNANDGMRVWRVANPAEREALHRMLAAKLLNSKTLSVDQKKGFLSEMSR